jgi:HAD superfamily hydrolase (TIGR01509 family)
MTIRAAILDVDGTLVDSNDLHARAWVDTFREAKIDVPFEKVRPLIGMGSDNLLPTLGMNGEGEQAEQLSERRAEIFKEKYLRSVKPFPGTRDLLKKMRDAGLELAVASSASKGDLKPLLEIAGALDLIDSKTSADDADNSKPDPDIVQAALKRVRARPAEALMLGDTPYDIEAAARAGVKTVAFRCGGWDDAGLAGAIAIYDGPADLLRRFDDSPYTGGS